jgi:hypothetical protein
MPESKDDFYYIVHIYAEEKFYSVDHPATGNYYRRGIIRYTAQAEEWQRMEAGRIA